jgi:preprotein translocase subunit YajC
MENLWILAEAQAGKDNSVVTSVPVNSKETITTTTTQAPTEPNMAGTKPKSLFGEYGQIFFLVILFVFMYFVLFRGPKKREKEQRNMVSSLQKNDKVQTAGGIIGTVVEAKEDEVVIKIDESTNAKLRVIPGAIVRNLSQDKK